MRILFLGNSFTFFNDLPGQVGQLLQAETFSNVRGGAHLHQHLDPADELCTVTRRLLTEGKWDYVDLQDHSRGPIEHPDAFHQAVATLCPMIRAAGGKPVLYETWAYEEGTEALAATGLTFTDMQQRLSDAYLAAARANRTLLAPVGSAFAQVRTSQPLYADDHFHPSEAGTQVAARVIAGVLQATP